MKVQIQEISDEEAAWLDKTVVKDMARKRKKVIDLEPAQSEQPKPEEQTQPLSSDEPITDDMSQTTEPPSVAVALMKRDLDDVRAQIKSQTDVNKAILDQLGDISKKVHDINKAPLAIVPHGDKLDVSCPNCGTTGTFQQPAPTAKTFDDVLSMFDQPHEGGGNALMCKNCRPKIDSMLQKSGLKLVEAKK